MEQKSKMSNVEWGLFIGALLMVDGVQVLLEWLTLAISSLTINPFIDLFLTMAIPFYLHIRGENMWESKRVIGLVAGLVGELIPGIDEFPLWSAYGVYLFALSKSDTVIKKVPGLSAVNNVTSITQGKKPKISNVVGSDDEQKVA